jgi:hypothetical protein
VQALLDLAGELGALVSTREEGLPQRLVLDSQRSVLIAGFTVVRDDEELAEGRDNDGIGGNVWRLGHGAKVCSSRAFAQLLGSALLTRATRAAFAPK